MRAENQNRRTAFSRINRVLIPIKGEIRSLRRLNTSLKRAINIKKTPRKKAGTFIQLESLALFRLLFLFRKLPVERCQADIKLFGGRRLVTAHVINNGFKIFLFLGAQEGLQ